MEGIDVSGRSVCFPVAIALCGLTACPSVVDAHLVTTGLGPVYDGIGHLLLTPQDFIAVLALCLLAGLRGPAHSRQVLFLLPLVWFVAGSLVASRSAGFGSFPFAAVSLIALGALVAADLKLSAWGVSALAILLGAVHGLDNGVALRPTAGWLGLLGIVIGLFVMVAITTAIVISVKQPWARIAVRVLGSWIVATGIIMMGWHYRLERNVDNAPAVSPTSSQLSSLAHHGVYQIGEV